MTHVSRRVPVIVRAAKDVADGKALLAIQRLGHRLTNVGYEDETLQALAETLASCGDVRSAGAAWLLTSARGDHVEEAIARHVAACGQDLAEAIRNTPMPARRCPVGRLPEAALDRVRRAGLWIPADPSRPLLPRDSEFRPRPRHGLANAGCTVLFAVVAVLAVVGIVAWSIAGVRYLMGW